MKHHVLNVHQDTYDRIRHAPRRDSEPLCAPGVEIGDTLSLNGLYLRVVDRSVCCPHCVYVAHVPSDPIPPPFL